MTALPMQTVSTGFVVAIVGFFSSFPIVLQGLAGMGASGAEASSGLMAASLAMGLTGIALSLWKRQPIGVAWSTPGVALLAVMPPSTDGFSGAIGAFLFAGALTMIAGLWRPLGRLAAAIPAPLAQAMLGGVLLPLCILPFEAIASAPLHALPIVLTWFLIGRLNRLFAVPASVLIAALVVLISVDFELSMPDGLFTNALLTTPAFSLSSIIGIGLPLFIVTMVTQNIPGIAILKSYGYTPPPGPLLASVGGASVLSAPFGAPATCLAAITAAMCASEDSHPDPERRYASAVVAGVFYCLLGLFAGAITGFASLAPPLVLGTLAGVALIGVFTNVVQSALNDQDYREAAAITFLVTASGLSIFGLGAAVWGLVAGGLVQLVRQRKAA